MNKTGLRTTILERRMSLSAEDVASKSSEICCRLIRDRIFITASSIGLYWPIKNEVETQSIFHAALSAHKRVGLPRVIPDDRRINYISITDESTLTTGAYGILEPIFDMDRVIPPDDLDLIVVPGVVFDERGYRIGYGGGYFDRFLSDDTIRSKSAAMAFDFQVVPHIDEEPHDRQVAMIVTEHRIIVCI